MEIARGVGGEGRSKLCGEMARYWAAAQHRRSQDGLATAVLDGARPAGAHLVQPVTVAHRRGRTFDALGTALPYETTRYNNSWLNERTVEISLARHVLRQHRPRSVLEVGNVLRNYRLEELDDADQTVIDRYEEIDDAVNEDVRFFRTDRRYDAVISISTLEHVGLDETEKDPDGPVKALETMRHHLADDGVLLVTVPMGYNASLDAAIVDHRFSCPKEFSLRRTSIDNRWVQDDVQAGHDVPYGSRFRNANAVYVGLQYGHGYSAET